MFGMYWLNAVFDVIESMYFDAIFSVLSSWRDAAMVLGI